MTPKRANLLVRRFRAGYRAEQEIRDFCGQSEMVRQIQLGPIEDAPLFMQTMRANFAEFSQMICDELFGELRLLHPGDLLQNTLRHRKFMAKINARQNLNFENGDGI